MESETQVDKKTSRLPVAGVLVLVLVAIGFFIFKGFNQKEKLPGSSVNNTNVPEVTGQITGETGSVKEFTVKGTNFAFNPSVINVQKGDTIKITFFDEKGTHNLIIAGYDVSSRTIGPGGSDVVQFVADKAGTFAFYCGIAGHKDFGMEGKLIVAE